MRIQNYLSVIALFVLGSSLSAQVVINEFSASNYNQFVDGFGGDEDWIELYNTSNVAVDISGYYLSDKLDNPTKWEIPAGTVIPGNGYYQVWASSRDEFDGQNWHTNFKITQTRANEDVVLANAAGAILDSYELAIPNQMGHSRGRFPDGANSWKIFLDPTPEATNANAREEYVTKPSLQPAAGYYTGPTAVSILPGSSGTTVYYTLDGTSPTTASAEYTGPFTIEATTVVKAIAYSDDPNTPPSFTDYHTYIIDETFTVPILSISGDEVFDLLLGNVNGEPIGTIELFTADGNRVADASGDFNKHGNDSWAYAQRGIDLIVRDQLGDDYAVKHQIFPEETERDKFQRLILKPAANDNYSFEAGGAHIRDAFVHTLSQKANLHLDERTYEACILLVNGEYWGVYEIREKVDDHDYTSYYYGQNRFEIDFIKTWGNTWEEYGSIDEWDELTAYISTNDMADPANYAYVSERLDVESLLDYIILHSHNVSADWLNWNTAWWRGRDPDGGAQRWRYILWDEDATYGHYINYTFIPDQGPTADPCNIELISPETDFEGHLTIFARLFENPDFFALYINRYADLTNTYLGCDFMLELLDSMVDRIRPEMPRQIARWGGTMEGWELNVEELRNFMLTRCTIISDGMIDCYEDDGITGPFELVINVAPEGAGRVRANTVEGLTYPWMATYYGGIEIELEALANPNHEFVYWEVANNIFAPDEFQAAIQMSLTSNDDITAYFSGFIPCPEATNVVIDANFTSAGLSWEINGSPLAYLVRYRVVGETEWQSEATQNTDFTVQGLEFCTTYELQIQSVCNSSTSETTIYYFETDCTNDTEELDPIVDLQAYPNPFTDAFRVDLILAEGGLLDWELFNGQGQLIRQERGIYHPSGQNRLDIGDLSGWSSGVYWLRLAQGGDFKQLKMVKM
jgi:hypothetical protein